LAAGGRYAEAVVQLRHADKVAHGYHAGWVQRALGNALRELGDLEGGAAAFRKAIRIAPGTARFHVDLGRVLAELGRRDDAAAALREALRLRPDEGGAYEALGRVLLPSGDYEGAAAAFGEATRLRPSAPGGGATAAASLAGAERLRGLVDKLPAVLDGRD